MIRLAYTRTVAPILQPISLAEAKAQARIVHDNSNGVLLGYIKTATHEAEQFMARGLLTQTWQCWYPGFAESLWLPMAAPLQNDALASPSTVPIVQYYDGDGVLQTLATSYYTVDTMSRPGRIVRKANQSWPSTQSDRGAGSVLVTYVVGWSAANLIPESIRQGIRSYVTYLDADRDGLLDQADRARQAAENAWKDVVYNIPLECA